MGNEFAHVNNLCPFGLDFLRSLRARTHFRTAARNGAQGTFFFLNIVILLITIIFVHVL